jgi:mannose-1-phosphate guanylyltransferase
MTIGSTSWAIVLAGGEGSRLHGLAIDDSGDTVPKQFCSLMGGQSLLSDTLQRAASVVEPDPTCVIVTAQHRHWWEPILSGMSKSNIIVQPSNRGTGNGVLLPLLHILSRDPGADFVLLPSDHYVCDADPDLGCIVPGRGTRPHISLVDRGANEELRPQVPNHGNAESEPSAI